MKSTHRVEGYYLQGPARKIFIEFLERSCTAEFSGFLLYKELGRRLKKTNPVVAEVRAAKAYLALHLACRGCLQCGIWCDVQACRQSLPLSLC